MPSFITDTPEKLKVEWVNAARSNLVVIVGDRTKILYEGEDAADAKTVYDGVKAHYDKRAAERGKGQTEQEKNELEAKVEYQRFKKARF